MEKGLAKETGQTQKRLTFPDTQLVGTLCGGHNAHLHILEKRIGLSVHVRGNHITLQGGDWEIDLAEKVLTQLYGLIKGNYPIYTNDVEYAVSILSGDISADLNQIFQDKVYVSAHKKVITPKSKNQKAYIDSIMNAPDLAPRDALRVRGEISEHLYHSYRAALPVSDSKSEAASRAMRDFGDPAVLGKMIASARGRLRTFMKKNGAVISVAAAALICLTGVIAVL